ncbi:hypothetical protein [Streptomyces sp. VRA16 Mangrove soil]|uniref:hypothetical protein n=1 Tax=Streptomyces sp. VRA16 Mangrove soil TaxID=2817434 RepID=UPI001AA00334|nr:hypothetical protein [Streptomyces sp. VRA16 Mangrove soil]MBO1337573.1 hypothetical protein [Streptomyces sp. VRA16 Mangrove soil]
MSRPHVPPGPSVPATRRAPAPTSSSAAAPRWVLPAAVLAGTALVGLRATALGQWIVDDAAVTFAYVRSLGEGLGPVQQAGAGPVEGYSNPAWLLLLLVGRALGLFDRGAWSGVSDLVLFPKALALGCVAGTLACVGGAARVAVGRRAWIVVLATGALLAANLSYVVWAFSGLENALYGLCAAALALLLARGRPGPRAALGAAALALAAALTRPDGAVLAAAYPLTVLLRRQRGAVRDGLLNCSAFGACYGLFLLWRHSVFGLWVPNTAVAKSQQAPEPEELAKVGDLLGYAGWALVLVGVGCAGLVAARPGPARRVLGTLCVPLALALIAFGALAPDWMPLYRFATPVWVLGSAVAALAGTAVWTGTRARGRVLVGCGVAGALTLSLTGQAAHNREFTHEPTLSMCWVADRYGRTFDAYADRLGLRPGATVALPDLGGTLLTTRLKVVDLAGLTDRRIADAYAARDRAALVHYVLREVRPALLHVHAAWPGRSGLTRARLTAAGYVPLYREENGGDYVLASAVPGGARRIAAVRSWARPVIDRMRHEKHQERGRLGDCGARLVPPSGAAGQALRPAPAPDAPGETGPRPTPPHGVAPARPLPLAPLAPAPSPDAPFAPASWKAAR